LKRTSWVGREGRGVVFWVSSKRRPGCGALLLVSGTCTRHKRARDQGDGTSREKRKEVQKGNSTKGRLKNSSGRGEKKGEYGGELALRLHLMGQRIKVNDRSWGHEKARNYLRAFQDTEIRRNPTPESENYTGRSVKKKNSPAGVDVRGLPVKH